MENIIKDVSTVKELYDFLKVKIEENPEIYENGMVAISTGVDPVMTGALYAMSAELVTDLNITLVPETVMSC